MWYKFSLLHFYADVGIPRVLHMGCMGTEFRVLQVFDMIRYMIYLTQLGSHPVAVVQYTYTHKQYRERHKTNSRYNTKIRKSVGHAPFLRALPWHLPYD
jgi:hypothetical protein